MPRAAKGHRFGGRQKGTPNKASAKKAAAIAKTGVTPLDFLLKVMRNTKLPMEERLMAAKSAAPYVHPKLQSIVHQNPDGSNLVPDALDGTEVARRVAFLLAQGLNQVTP